MKMTINITQDQLDKCVSIATDPSYGRVIPMSQSESDKLLYNLSHKITFGERIPDEIEVGDYVKKYGGIYEEKYGIVTNISNGVYTVIFRDGHISLVTKDALHKLDTNYKSLLTKLLEKIEDVK